MQDYLTLMDCNSSLTLVYCAELSYLAVLLVLLKADSTVEVGKGAGVVNGRCLAQVTDGQIKGFDVVLQRSSANTASTVEECTHTLQPLLMPWLVQRPSCGACTPPTVKTYKHTHIADITNLHLHLHPNCRAHWRWLHNQFPPFFSVLHCPLGLDDFLAYPFPDVVFPPLLLSVLSSSPFHCALQMVLARPDEWETWPYHCSVRLFTIVRRSSCGPIACWILVQTSLS